MIVSNCILLLIFCFCFYFYLFIDWLIDSVLDWGATVSVFEWIYPANYAEVISRCSIKSTDARIIYHSGIKKGFKIRKDKEITGKKEQKLHQGACPATRAGEIEFEIIARQAGIEPCTFDMLASAFAFATDYLLPQSRLRLAVARASQPASWRHAWSQLVRTECALSLVISQSPPMLDSMCGPSCVMGLTRQAM